MFLHPELGAEETKQSVNGYNRTDRACGFCSSEKSFDGITPQALAKFHPVRRFYSEAKQHI
jgi:hypothetical protein